MRPATRSGRAPGCRGSLRADRIRWRSASRPSPRPRIRERSVGWQRASAKVNSATGAVRLSVPVTLMPRSLAATTSMALLTRPVVTISLNAGSRVNSPAPIGVRSCISTRTSYGARASARRSSPAIGWFKKVDLPFGSEHAPIGHRPRCVLIVVGNCYPSDDVAHLLCSAAVAIVRSREKIEPRALPTPPEAAARGCDGCGRTPAARRSR